VIQDEAGNVIVRKFPAEGMENAPTVILQGHMDMVCEKNNDVDHDFQQDPIQLDVRDKYLYAKGTSLGADDGIGVATMLAVLESKFVSHGPLEMLFTVDEETGLTGAFQLSSTLLKGKILINLDSEEDGTIYIGCAGGGGTNITLSLEATATPLGMDSIRFTVHGLSGGHSGVDIHEQRGNAVKILARVLRELNSELPITMTNIFGGDKHNAIPREAYAEFLVEKEKTEAVMEFLDKMLEVVKPEYQPREPNLAFKVEVMERRAKDCWLRKTTDRVLDLLCALPNGVLKMNYDIPELVETSTNLAFIKVEDGALKLHMSTRSSVGSELEKVTGSIEAIAALSGAEAQHEDPYPGWQPNLDSKLLAKAIEVYKELFDKEPEVKAIHAGLETGIIGEKFPGMDMISIGPQIEHPHSPDERVEIPTVEKFWNFTVGLLENIKE